MFGNGWSQQQLEERYHLLALKNIKVNNQGVFLDGELVNQNVRLNNLNLDKSNKVLLKIGNKPNAQHVGGFNLFSKNFGDYPIDIELTAVVEKV